MGERRGGEEGEGVGREEGRRDAVLGIVLVKVRWLGGVWS